MPLNDAILETLNDIRSVARKFQDDWWLYGSAAALLSGAQTDTVNDVDLLLSADDARKLNDEWRQCRLPPPKPSDQFRSDPFYRFQRALPVEAAANFEMFIEGEWAPVRFATRIEIDGLFVAAPSEQIELFRRMNRAKDAPRIASLKTLIQSDD